MKETTSCDTGECEDPFQLRTRAASRECEATSAPELSRNPRSASCVRSSRLVCNQAVRAFDVWYNSKPRLQKSLSSSTDEEAEIKEQKYPPGWDENRVKELIAHYESQTEDEEFADIEASREDDDITLMAIPTELVPKVRALLAGK